MFESIERGIGLDIVLMLQDQRTPVLNVIAEILNFANYDLFYLVLLVSIYYLFNKQLGIRALFVLVAATVAALTLKDLFARPRPFMVSDEVMPLFTAEGYGLPSGHTLMPLVVVGYLAVWTRRGWMIGLALAYAALHGLARIYGGVHFPQDVIGGYVIGLLLLAVCVWLDDPVAALWRARSQVQQVGLLLVVAAAGIILLAYDDGLLTATGILVGGGLAQSIEERRIAFQPHPSRWKRGAALVAGLLISVATLVGLDVVFDIIAEPAALLRVVRYALVALVAMAVVPWLCVRLGWMQSDISSSDASPATTVQSSTG